MNKKSWFVIISLALLLSGGFFILSSSDDVSARSLSTSTKQIAESTELHAVLETVTFDVPSMTCASCPFIVTKTLKSVPGVTEAGPAFAAATAQTAAAESTPDRGGAASDTSRPARRRSGRGR